MGVIVDIMQIASVRRIIETAEKAIEEETGAAVKLSVLMHRDDVVDMDFVLRLICSMTNVTREQLTGESRVRVFADARKIFTVLCRDILECTWNEIGKALGDRDHTTIINLYSAGCNMIQTKDALFLPKYSMVRESFLQHLQRQVNEAKA